MKYFDGTWQKCRTGPDDMSGTRMTTLPFLLLVFFSLCFPHAFSKKSGGTRFLVFRGAWFVVPSF